MQGISRWPGGTAAIEEDGEGQDTAFSAGRTAVRRAISGPLTPVTRGLSRSLADTLLRRSGHVTGPDGTDSQADSAGSIPVTRSTLKAQVRGLTVSPGLTSRRSSDTVRAISERGPARRSDRPRRRRVSPARPGRGCRWRP
jgi:hypothetical protein